MTVRFGNWIAERELGEGGFGKVYACRHSTAPGATAAVKVLLDDHQEAAALRDRFAEEIRIQKELGQHPNLCAFYESQAPSGGAPGWVAMELCRGRSLRSCLSDGLFPADEGRFGPPLPDLHDRAGRRAFAAQMVRQAARACAHAHARAIVHRDIKPENMMLEPDGRLLVLDFGGAKDQRGAGLTQLDRLKMYTPDYVAPEVMRGVIDPALLFRVDVYALGVVLFELLTGDVPAPSPVTGVRADALRLPAAWGEEWVDLVRQMTALDPRDRLDMPAVVVAVERALRGSTASPRPDPPRAAPSVQERRTVAESVAVVPPPEPAARSSSSAAGWVVAAVVTLCAIAAVGSPWRSASPPPSPAAIPPGAYSAAPIGAAAQPAAAIAPAVTPPPAAPPPAASPAASQAAPPGPAQLPLPATPGAAAPSPIPAAPTPAAPTPAAPTPAAPTPAAPTPAPTAAVPGVLTPPTAGDNGAMSAWLKAVAAGSRSADMQALMDKTASDPGYLASFSAPTLLELIRVNLRLPRPAYPTAASRAAASSRLATQPNLSCADAATALTWLQADRGVDPKSDALYRATCPRCRNPAVPPAGTTDPPAAWCSQQPGHRYRALPEGKGVCLPTHLAVYLTECP